jgi:hypothetical protein
MTRSETPDVGHPGHTLIRALFYRPFYRPWQLKNERWGPLKPRQNGDCGIKKRPAAEIVV